MSAAFIDKYNVSDVREKGKTYTNYRFTEIPILEEQFGNCKFINCKFVKCRFVYDTGKPLLNSVFEGCSFENCVFQFCPNDQSKFVQSLIVRGKIIYGEERFSDCMQSEVSKL